MATLGNATDFGDLTSSKTQLKEQHHATRGVFAGGHFDPMKKMLLIMFK